MVQEIGETRDAIMKDDEKRIQDIIYANRALTDLYWIVIFAKPSKIAVDGLPTLIKHIKAYKVKPKSMVGMIIAQVNNSKGTIKWEVNMPQIPFDFDALHKKVKTKRCDEVVVETTTIPGAYITK